MSFVVNNPAPHECRPPYCKPDGNRLQKHDLWVCDVCGQAWRAYRDPDFLIGDFRAYGFYKISKRKFRKILKKRGLSDECTNKHD